MVETKFDLGDYVEVKDRIKILHELYAGARLVTSEVTVLTDPSGKQRVMVKALAYRSVDDPLPGVGHSWMELPGTTPYTKGSELENTETSAWGRAIASLGILVDHSIASAQEVKNKEGGSDKAADKPTDITTGETLRSLGDIERSGAVAKGAGRHSDLEWRQTPDGYHVGFLLEVGDGKAKPQVSLEGPLAVSVFAATAGAPMLGMRTTVKGELFEITAPGRRKLYRIVASAMETDEWIVPPREAESIPLGIVKDDDLSDVGF